MLVGICSPSTGQLPLEFVNCLMQLQRDMINNKIPHIFNIQSGSFLPHTRAKCTGASIDNGIHQWPFNNKDITHLVLIDTDIIFTSQQIFDLINRNVDVVAGMYPYSDDVYEKESDKRIVAGMWDDKSEDIFKEHHFFPPLSIGEASHISTLSKSEIIKVDWVGLGIAVIKPKVFFDIEYPWFNSELIKINNIIETTSEDIGFCRKVTKAGYTIYLDTKVRVQHFKGCRV